MRKIDNKNANYYDRVLLGVVAKPIDEQIIYLCKKGKAYRIPLEILASQYKYALTHDVTADEKRYLANALETICPSLKIEMEGLYVNR